MPVTIEDMARTLAKVCRDNEIPCPYQSGKHTPCPIKQVCNKVQAQDWLNALEKPKPDKEDDIPKCPKCGSTRFRTTYGAVYSDGLKVNAIKTCCDCGANCVDMSGEKSEEHTTPFVGSNDALKFNYYPPNNPPLVPPCPHCGSKNVRAHVVIKDDGGQDIVPPYTCKKCGAIWGSESGPNSGKEPRLKFVGVVLLDSKGEMRARGASMGRDNEDLSEYENEAKEQLAEDFIELSEYKTTQALTVNAALALIDSLIFECGYTLDWIYGGWE